VVDIEGPLKVTQHKDPNEEPDKQAAVKINYK